MKCKSLISKAFPTAAALAFMTIPLSANAEIIGYMGDVNHDMQITVADLVILSNHLIADEPLSSESAYNADIDKDGRIDVFDYVLLRQYVSGLKEPEPIEVPDATTTTTIMTEIITEPPTTTTTTTVQPSDSDFITPPVKDVKAFLPSQGNANLVIFYIDFPDCQYTYAPSADEIAEIAFGAEDTADKNFPFDSMSAFYNRSSKGAMNLNGTVLRYTTQHEQAYYNEDKFLITQECYDAFKDTVDFSQYDGDNDGYIDATLFTVPTAAGDEYWWPCAGPVDRDEYTVDGKKVGHIITGNAQIEAVDDYYNFNSSYLHEMGHCMGLPDYYLYTNPIDFEGMHGVAGIELMDADATTDFGAVSKLQLGWYKDKSQIFICEDDLTSASFVLNNAQGENSNCVIIPRGDLDGYHSEYMIIEYTTATGNNSNPAWWVMSGEGVRVYHAETSLIDNGYWTGYKYGSGSSYTDNDNGRRYIRIIDDTEGYNLYRAGDVIDSSITGFNWYDDNGQQTIDTGYIITVEECDGDKCTINISKK